MQPTERDKQMLNEHDADISTRVTRLEGAVESLTGTMVEVSQSIKQIERSISSIGKTDMKTLITIAGSVVTVAVTIWAILIAPLNQQIIDMKTDLIKMDNSINSHYSLPSDISKLHKSLEKNTDRIELLERKEASSVEREKYQEEVIKDLLNRDKLKR